MTNTNDEPPTTDAAASIDNCEPQRTHNKSTTTPLIQTTSTATQTAARAIHITTATPPSASGAGVACCTAVDSCFRNISYQVSNALGELFYRWVSTVHVQCARVRFLTSASDYKQPIGFSFKQQTRQRQCNLSGTSGSDSPWHRIRGIR